MSLLDKLRSLLEREPDDKTLDSASFGPLANNDFPDIRMIEDGDTLELHVIVDCALKNIIYRLRVQLPVSTWKLVVEFVRLAKECWHEKNRLVNKFRIGVEILYIMSKMDPDELVKVYGTTGDTRNSLYDDRLLKFVNDVMLPGFTYKMEAEGGDEIAVWISKILAQPAVIDGIRRLVHKVFQKEISIAAAQELTKSFNVYTTEKNLGFLAGCTLRDGIILIKPALACSSDQMDDRFRAAILTLSLHEFGHLLLRRFNGNYSFSSPISDLGRLIEKRVDPIIPGKGLEGGRALELICFGGIQVDWDRTDKAVASDFFYRIVNGKVNHLPLLNPVGPGVRERRTPSLSFAGALSMRGPFPHIE